MLCYVMLCMYACMHACMHVCTYVRMYVRTYVCMYVYIYIMLLYISITQVESYGFPLTFPGMHPQVGFDSKQVSAVIFFWMGICHGKIRRFLHWVT